jgi:hypothetical protein
MRDVSGFGGVYIGSDTSPGRFNEKIIFDACARYVVSSGEEFGIRTLTRRVERVGLSCQDNPGSLRSADSGRDDTKTGDSVGMTQKQEQTGWRE